MASGVKVADGVKEMLLSMKLNRSSDDANERIRVVELGLNDANTEIEVKQVIMEKDVKTLGNVFKFVQCLMGEKECRYIVYDCHYETPQTKKEDLIFIMWSCDHASPKSRMVYSSSKSAVKKIMDFKFELELHGKDETTPQSFCGKMGKEKVLKLEGLDVKES
ncbi:hypothetical protein NQD34_011259 [Periophthalmus magnuspinnatus]|uniref:non-muscle cofilin 1-like n=1 Tax=Periophthalmus magnuspinnatus TaxID=409849 RepID=UPI00145BDF31|nr:non-muscle cofilin 1-like [Periophthalmus magnuspinnatus]KAJ0005045.1 hypothetical protein NQD34_011259 [Periophthalmus magnuspinnatus]